MTVFTGPNNSGKSVLLRELVTSVYVHPGTQEPIRWIKNLEMQREGSGGDFISWLAERGIGSRRNPQNSRLFLPNNNPHSDEFGVSVDSASSNWDRGRLGPIGHFLVNDQWTDTRLSNQTNSEQGDWSKPASHPSQVLWESAEHFKKFSDLFQRAFGTPIAINRYVPQIRLQLGSVEMADTAPPPPPELRDAYASLPYIDGQGDGMRAFANLLLHSLVRPAPVIVIDEPEAFLHPPQVRLLAHYLTRYTPAPCQVFVATHSADFLYGALEGSAAMPGTTPQSLTLVRLSRATGTPTARALDSESVREILNTPLLRYSNIISGMFHDGVVLCESEGDCQFYSATLDVIRGSSPHENLTFLHVNGKARLSDAARKLRACGVPVAAIADLDFLNDTTRIRSTLNHLGGNWDEIKADALAINKEASSEIAATAANEIKHKIASIIGSPRGKELLAQQKIDAIIETLKTANGWKKIKTSGVQALTGESYAAIGRLISYFARLGLFLVPVGELECWVRDISPSNKAMWLTHVFDDGRHLNPSDELQQFCSGVRDYLKRKTEEAL
ncbi:AAA family ATPase [Streptomyces chartreusis]|uniref:ATP-binding protein n=1 Tax=Streptomyces chartreusis TaxID=1969 RepID=A0A7H8TD35_STRCX|nr:ATP-binding protein [Streptomyces chartreusis]QKZ20928.1 ATP-binding protein [Streptomyces chartreusis]